MNDLIEVKDGLMWVDSQVVAKKFGMQHTDFIKIANKVIAKLKKLRPDAIGSKYLEEQRHYRGTDFVVYLMSREFFSLVSMRLKSDRAFEWQAKFNEAFYAMETALLKAQTNKSDIEWTSTRLIGKTARLEVTDAIQEFVEYATEQGSRNAQHYYSNITKCTYRALGLMAQRHPKLRDEMSIYEVSELLLAERLAASKIREYMLKGRNYKDIYQTVKDDLLSFSDAMCMVHKKES